MRIMAGADERQSKAGGWAALYVALAYVAAMPYFLLFVKTGSVTDPTEKVALLVKHSGSLQAFHLFTYVIFGIVLAVLALALYRRLKDDAPVLAQVATAVGVIWAAVLIASGMVYNAGVSAVVGLNGNDAAQAVSVWQSIEPVVDGLGGAGGELLGGLWVLLVSVAAVRTKAMPRVLGWLGVALGAVGILSVVPPLRDLIYVFGMLQIVWFGWTGVVLLRARSRVVATSNRAGASSTGVGSSLSVTNA